MRSLKFLSFFTLCLVSTLPAQGSEYVITTPTNVTNGGAGNTLDGDDSLVVTDSGSITTAGANAVFLTGDGNSVQNFGTLTTSGNSGFDGIELQGSSNFIQNSGYIITSGQQGFGIRNNTASSDNYILNTGNITTYGILSSGIAVTSNTNTRIVNSGSIVTIGGSAVGILNSLGTSNFILNSGTIETSGNLGFALAIGNSSGTTVVNSGTIITRDEDAYGFFDSFSVGTVFRNSGSISTAGDDAYGIYLDTSSNAMHTNSGTINTSGNSSYGYFDEGGSSNTFTNSGAITTTGPASTGIRSVSSTNGTYNNSGIVAVTSGSGVVLTGSGHTFNNSGKLLSRNSNAFANLASDTTLNLTAPSFLAGTLAFITPTTTNIVTGPSHSDLWTFVGTFVGGGPTISGAVPGFYNSATQQFATFDPTVFSALRDELADVAGSTSLMVQTRLDGSCCNSNRGNLWISGLGSTYRYGGNHNATLGYRFNYWGVVAGYDKQINRRLFLGLMGGYGKGKSTANDRFTYSFDNDAEGGIVAIYGRANAKGFFLDFDLGVGNLNHSDDRFINDNLAPLGVAAANANYTGIWVSPEVAVGANLIVSKTWVVKPNLRYRYAWESFDNYTESGLTDANAQVRNQNASIGEFRAELATQGYLGFGCLWGRVGYLYRDEIGSNSADVTLLGQTLTVPSFYRARSAGYIGLDAQFNLGGSAAFNIGGELTGGNGIRGAKGEIALIIAY